MERSKRKSRPSMEGLEGRMLLTAIHRHNPNLPDLFSNSEVAYTTPQGSRVDLKITGGPGSLKGTTVDSSGNLNLVYSGTTVFSTISSTVKGGTGQASLSTLTNANVPIGSLTGLGGELLGRVILPQFNLISGGDVNLLAGVQVFTLNSVSPNSQVHLRDTPLNTTLGIPSYVNTVTGAGTGYAKLSSTSTGATSSSASGLASGTSVGAASGSSSAGFSINGQGTLTPTAVGFGGGSVGSINGAIPIINTVGNGENVLGTPGLTQAQVNQGRTTTYITNAGGGTELSRIGGTFAPGANLIVPSDVSLPPTVVPPPGVIVTINHVNGGPTVNTPPLGNAQIYGYDATTNALIRFDTVTGDALQSIALPVSSTGVGGISLARNGSELVVLVGIGPNVFAYDASTGAAVGQLSTSSLATEGLTTVTGVATGGQLTVLEDALDGANGTIQAINVGQSLGSGLAVPINGPYSPTNQFGLAGTLTGVLGTGNIFALGSGFFNSSEPSIKQAGILTITPSTTGLSEATRAALLTKTANYQAAGTNNGVAGSTSIALGSLDANLALDTGVVNGQNVIQLRSPNGLSIAGSFNLNDANPLADLSQSFHPELTNTALIDVQGNVQSFTARTATGMVLNVAGNMDLLAINNASNSSVIALPFAHVKIPVRSNVSITTNSRLVGTRGGVIVNASQPPVGPLFLD